MLASFSSDRGSVCPCRQCSHQFGHRAGMGWSSAVQFTAMTAIMILGLLSIPTRASSFVGSQAMTMEGDIPSARSLLQSDGERHSFLDELAEEPASVHLEELYANSGSKESIAQWMLESVRSSTAVDEHSGDEHAEDMHSEDEHAEDMHSEDEHAEDMHSEDEHAEHMHSEDEHAEDMHSEEHAEDMHSEDEHAEHMHSEDEHSEDEHSEDEHAVDVSGREEHSEDEHDVGVSGREEHSKDEHAGHGHGTEQHATVLTAASLLSLRLPSDEDATFVDRIAPYVLACQADPACQLDDSGVDSSAEIEPEAKKTSLVGLKLLIAVIFLIETVVGSLLPQAFRKHRHFPGIMACFNVFSGASFLTVGIMHLLPHVIEYEEEADFGSSFPVGLCMTVVGFILILLFERVIFDIHCSDLGNEATSVETRGMYHLVKDPQMTTRILRDPLITSVAVLLHAILECIVLGVADDRSDVLVLFGAIASHKVFAAVGLGTRFLHVGKCSALLMSCCLLPYHILPPLAIVISAYAGSIDVKVSLILTGLATGTFIYVGAFEVTSEEFGERALEQKCPNSIVSNDGADTWTPTQFQKWCVFVVGAGVLMAISLAVPEGDAHNH